MTALAGTGHATGVNWKVDGTFDDGATFHGSFGIDPSTDTITRWDFNTTADVPFLGINYSPCLNPYCGILGSSTATDNSGTLDLGSSFLFFLDDLQLTNLPLTTGGLVTALTGQESQAECLFGCFSITRTITGGTAVGLVPEPATWATMLLGLGGLGGMMRRRRALSAA
jgi:hypothetical protein